MDFATVSRRADRFAFEQIADILDNAIRSGEIPPRTMLPSEQEIMHQAGVSRATVRRAMQELRERGVAYTRPNLGTFAAPDPPPRER